MRPRISRIVMFAATAFVGFVANASYLYWQVGDGAGEYSYAAVCVVDSSGNTLQEDGANMWLEPVVATGQADEPKYAVTDLGIYSSSEYSFFVELVNSEYSTVATSTVMTYAQLASNIADIGTAIPTVGFHPWVAFPQTTPEPTGGVMLLLGAAMLALRRRQSATP